MHTVLNNTRDKLGATVGPQDLITPRFYWIRGVSLVNWASFLSLFSVLLD